MLRGSGRGRRGWLGERVVVGYERFVLGYGIERLVLDMAWWMTH